MAPSVVYDGDNDSRPVALFEGKRFFITQRVPSRPTWVESVKANGGVVVLFEKHADYLIADHVRRGKNQPGSISWTFIRDSVKNGKLEDPEHHQAGPPLGSVRQTVRMTRRPFTAEDDRILIQWVKNAEREGIPTRGNELYHKLELKAQHPQHTWQSWRDHWVKKLMHIPDILEYANLQEDNPAPAQNVTSELRRAKKSAVARSPPRRRPFTKLDFQNLSEAYGSILEVDETQVTEAWNEWAKEYPSHTAQEWRKFFEEIVKPQMESVEGPAVSGSGSTGAGSEMERLNDPGVNVPLPDTPSVYNESHLQAMTRADPSLLDEDVFRIELDDFSKAQELEVDLNPTICGRQVPLFRIWQVVRSEEFGGFDNVEREHLWHGVSRELNFDEWRHGSAPAELQSCYEQYLAGFEDAKLQHLEHSLAGVYGKSGDETDDAEEEALELPPALLNKRRLSPINTSNKRRRVDNYKDREIPSTPDILEKNHENAIVIEYEEESEDIYSRSPQLNTANNTPTPKPARPLEPETQDFQFQRSELFISDSDNAPHSEADADKQMAELQEYMHRFMALGYSQEVIIKALEATTMETGDAGTVMEALTNGLGIPPDIQGVWTEKDDQALAAPESSKEFQGILGKHGMDTIAVRREYLKARKLAQEELGSV